jgi:Zn-dependent protease with chaperone function
MKPLLILSACALAVAITTAFQPAAVPEKFSGYAEWRRNSALIIDGQRVTLTAKGKFKGDNVARSMATVPLGYEASGKGTRLVDGTLAATDLEVKPNGNALFESDVKQATAAMEAKWLAAGKVVETDSKGKEVSMGELHRSGPDVDRVRRIVDRLIPPYLKASDFRAYVVTNKDWNAFACANGMIVVYDALLHESDDDEMAIVLGHELVHATHEHSRKEFKSSMFLQLAVVGALAGAGHGDPNKANAVLGLASGFAMTTIVNGYSRDAEDQADRVGLRYAFEGGFDVRKGPPLWDKFAKKYGDQAGAANFFFGNHSSAEARAKNLRREIALNYPSAR